MKEADNKFISTNWIGDWIQIKNIFTDDDGWTYSNNFNGKFKAKIRTLDYV